MKKPKLSRALLFIDGVSAIMPLSTLTVLTLCVMVTGVKYPQWVYGPLSEHERAGE